MEQVLIISRSGRGVECAVFEHILLAAIESSRTMDSSGDKTAPLEGILQQSQGHQIAPYSQNLHVKSRFRMRGTIHYICGRRNSTLTTGKSPYPIAGNSFLADARDEESNEALNTSEGDLGRKRKWKCLFGWNGLANFASRKSNAKCRDDGEDKGGVQLTTTLREKWCYAILDRFCPSSATRQGRSKDSNKDSPKKSAAKQVIIPGFDALPEMMKSVLLSLISGESIFRDTEYTMDDICSWLAIVHDRPIPYMRSCVQALAQLSHVEAEFGFTAGPPVLGVDVSVVVNFKKLRMYKKFAKRVMQLNPEFDTHLNIWKGNKMSVDELPRSQKQRLKVLSMQNCDHLKTLDLRDFPRLRSLSILYCQKLETILGWESVNELGVLNIQFCPSYLTYPDLDRLPALAMCVWKLSAPQPALKLSQCSQLRDLAMVAPNLKEIGDFTTMKRLEILSLQECPLLSTISGISELLSLNFLMLNSCPLLDALPDLSGLKLLSILVIQCTRIAEVPGVEQLERLQYLYASHSKLKRLPDLRHLIHLREVWVEGTPLAESDPSSVFFKKTSVRFNTDSSMSLDIQLSDSEYEHSDGEDL